MYIAWCILNNYKAIAPITFHFLIEKILSNCWIHTGFLCIHSLGLIVNFLIFKHCLLLSHFFWVFLVFERSVLKYHTDHILSFFSSKSFFSHTLDVYMMTIANFFDETDITVMIFILKDVYWNKIHLPAINLTLLISRIRNILYSVRSFVIFAIHDKVSIYFLDTSCYVRNFKCNQAITSQFWVLWEIFKAVNSFVLI